MPDYDVIIVGARVAGSITATLLGEKGYRVLALDRAHFPSDTLSSHFFRAPSFRSFEQAGVLDEVLAVAPKLTVSHNVIDGHAFAEPVDEPEDFPFYMSIRRITLDDILVRRARNVPGVDLREGAKVNALLRDGDRVNGVRWTSSDGDAEAKASVVVGADGFYSFVAGEVKPEVEHAEPVNRAMYYAYFRDFAYQAGPAAEFHFRDTSLAYVFPSDDNLALLAVSVPIEQFGEFKSDSEGRLMQELESMVGIAPRLPAATREGPVRGTGNIPGYMRVPYGEGWALAGDSALIMDPWSGQGIDNASTHAVMLAQHLDEFLSGKADWQTAMQAYHTERNAFSKKSFQSTCKLSRDIRVLTRGALQRRGLG